MRTTSHQRPGEGTLAVRPGTTDGLSSGPVFWYRVGRLDRQELTAAGSALKLYVPSQCQRPAASAETSALAEKPANVPVPPEMVTRPVPAPRSSTTWPAAVFPDPASRTMSLSSAPSVAAEA